MGLPVRQRVDGDKELAPGEVCYFYKLRPWSTYPFLTRTAIRLLYKKCGWNTHDGSFETMAVYVDVFKTEGEAKRFAKERGWGVQVLPRNTPLPEQTCQYGLNYYPGGAPHVTTERDLALVAVWRRDLQTVLNKLNGVVGRVKAAP